MKNRLFVVFMLMSLSAFSQNPSDLTLRGVADGMNEHTRKLSNCDKEAVNAEIANAYKLLQITSKYANSSNFEFTRELYSDAMRASVKTTNLCLPHLCITEINEDHTFLKSRCNETKGVIW